MWAARPAAGATLTVRNVIRETCDMLRSRLRLFHRNCPTNPLVTCERRKTIPGLSYRGGSEQRCTHISRNSMHNTRGKFHHSNLVPRSTSLITPTVLIFSSVTIILTTLYHAKTLPYANTTFSVEISCKYCW